MNSKIKENRFQTVFLVLEHTQVGRATKISTGMENTYRAAGLVFETRMYTCWAPDSRRSIPVAFRDASSNGLLHFRSPIRSPPFPLSAAASYVMNAARPNIVYHYTSIIETTIVGINHVPGERRLNVPRTRFPIQSEETLSLLYFAQLCATFKKQFP